MLLVGVFGYNPCDSHENESANDATDETGNSCAQETAFFLFRSLRGGAFSRCFGGVLFFVTLEIVIRKDGGMFGDFLGEFVDLGGGGVFHFRGTGQTFDGPFEAVGITAGNQGESAANDKCRQTKD